MAGIQHASNNTARTEQFKRCIQCLNGAFRLCNDGFVSARQVTQIKHDGGNLAVLEGINLVKHCGMAVQDKMKRRQFSLLLQLL
ncbi:hypothetical protein D3C80_2003610 [compost metagenome]